MTGRAAPGLLAPWAAVHGDEGTEEPLTDAAAAGVEQFQKAALDAVRAARAMLDAAESVIKDPAALDSVVRTMATLARSAGETVVGFAAGASGAGRAADPDGDEAGGGSADDPDTGFERIRVD